MSNLVVASIKDKLWHRMREDLAQYAAGAIGSRLLMCCACGRFLPQEDFSLEHLIPLQALKQDPDIVKRNPATPMNVRAGNLLLCKKPLNIKQGAFYANGCNSWKGRFYDRLINEILFGKPWLPGKPTQNYVIAGLCLGYLAMVSEFGYAVVLEQSGLLMRRQFFSPFKFHPAVPDISQMLLTYSSLNVPPDASMWAKPFQFYFHKEGCHVAARTFGIVVPVSRDPRQPIARHLRVVPSRYKLRPDFSTVFH